MRSNLRVRTTNGPIHNIGLFAQRYADTTSELWDARKSQHYLRCASQAAPDDYGLYLERWRQAVRGAGGCSFSATLVSRMTVGLGIASPAENGIAINHTFGVPIIPGSTIKGAMRSIAQEMLGLTKHIKPSLSRKEILEMHGEQAVNLADVFGSVDGMSAVTVLDAWWCSGGDPFVQETWTPHHQSYMTQGAELPLETENPIPIPLLAVPAGARFEFAFLLPSEEWRSALQPVLDETLRRGFGAKHSQGYGRFLVEARDAVTNADEIDPEMESVPNLLPDSPRDQRFAGRVTRRLRSTALVEFGAHTVPVVEAPDWAQPGTKVWLTLKVTNGRPQSNLTARALRVREA